MTDLLDQRWDVSREATQSRVGEETVLLHLGTGTYFGLDATGTLVWQQLGTGRSGREICERLLHMPGAVPAVVEDDIRTFLGQLAEAGLIERV